jgi:hypothetical protein
MTPDTVFRSELCRPRHSVLSCDNPPLLQANAYCLLWDFTITAWSQHIRWNRSLRKVTKRPRKLGTKVTSLRMTNAMTNGVDIMQR